MDPKKTVPGLANARWRVQVEHQGHEALKKKCYSYQVVPINQLTSVKKEV